MGERLERDLLQFPRGFGSLKFSKILWLKSDFSLILGHGVT